MQLILRESFTFTSTQHLDYLSKQKSTVTLLKIQHFILFSMKTTVTRGAQKSNALGFQPQPPFDPMSPFNHGWLCSSYTCFSFLAEHTLRMLSSQGFCDFSACNTISQYILSPAQCRYNKGDFPDNLTWNGNHLRSYLKTPNIITVPLPIPQWEDFGLFTPISAYALEQWRHTISYSYHYKLECSKSWSRRTFTSSYT